jgi:hypothetical protein
MIAALGKGLAQGLTQVLGVGGGNDDAPGEVEAKPETTGIKVEVWVELGETLNQKVTRFAAKLVKPHACGQWLVCDWEEHLKSNNPNFKGFQKIYRKKYKPTKMKQCCWVILNSDDGTDSNPEVWDHVQAVLNEFAERDVYIEREKKTLRAKK